MNDHSPQFILQKYWHYPDFRPGQLDIIQNILAQKDTLAILPTGGGKSICFQVPALLLPGITVVISPLISLMKDQVDQLVRRGISAVYLDSTLTSEQMQDIFTDIVAHQYKFIYVSPERLQSQKWRELCFSQLDISLIAIDEAHCVSLWGHDFRPSFLHIKDFVNRLEPRPSVVALTATTTASCTRDMLEFLGLQDPSVFTRSFARDNLFLNVVHCPTPTVKTIQLLRILRKHQHQSGIIYTLTRAAAKELATYLNKLSLTNTPVGIYHGALTKDERMTIQDNFMNGSIQLICATNAFGMGVDKSDIRFVVHWQPSANIENYYQEVGRAGRDGARGDCYLLIHPSDWEISRRMNECSAKNRQIVLQNKLIAMQKFTHLSKNHCRQNHIIHYFTNQPISALKPCQRCDLCQKTLFTMSNRDKLLLKQLLKLRKSLARQISPHLHPEFILPFNILLFILTLRPQTKEQFNAIPGIGRQLQPFYDSFKKLINSW